MKRKLGVALLVLATALAGAPEAARHFHDLNASLRHWVRTNLGGSFLVYAEGTNERALPDRYDYHLVAPSALPTDEHITSSYGLMASLSAPARYNGVCPFERHQASVRTETAPRAHAGLARVAGSSPRRAHATNAVQHEQLARVIERAVRGANLQALDWKIQGRDLNEAIRAQELMAKFKGLRLRPAVETIKTRRVAPVRVVRYDTGAPSISRFADLSTLPQPPLELARRNNDDETPKPPGAPGEAPAKRSGDNKQRKTLRPNQRTPDVREFDVAPFIIMASTDPDVKGLDTGCTGND